MPAPSLRRADLRADCSHCFALCCTALGFSRSADFPVDKPAGTPCPNLTPAYSCGIHESLRGRGYRGCISFDCLGAGQTVSQRLFAGVGWRERPQTRGQMFAAFAVVTQVHEMAWHLLEAQSRAYDRDLVRRAQAHLETIAALTGGSAEELLAADIAALHADVRTVLMAVSAEIRSSYEADGSQSLSKDLAGADLRGQSLCGADLRGACLIAADLRGCDLTAVDLLGADLRDVRIEGADLSRALYLTQSQANSSRGDARTRLPEGVDTPGHW
ncbi:pentapeptide repeat-containing protein [Tomitella biformata]|uniref:pentapeptide repeat-containing protein n=1 Tax=Tomitella biformata TaxID=630403 RepID=UPI000686A307|nr:pentapeptide repeat-containing protein [Tomitella biformata]